LRLVNTNMNGHATALIFRTFLKLYQSEVRTIRVLELDDLKIGGGQGLDRIPIEIQQGGSQKIAQYLLDLFESPDGEKIYRTKLMVVGFESVGKTTILDCLFPKTGWMKTKGDLLKTSYWFKLQGNKLSKYKSPDDLNPHKDKVVSLENRQWEIQALEQDQILLNPKAELGQKPIKMYCESQETRNGWHARLRRVVMNEATHGIEIQHLEIPAELPTQMTEKVKLNLSIWDFAGQHDYYNNHHYFLSTRTVFLVLWKMSDGEKGLQGLDFWFKSLAVHLKQSDENQTPSSSSERFQEPVYYSIIVVGTFLDHPSVDPKKKEERKVKIMDIANKAGIRFGVQTPLQYYEASCATLDNISEIQEVITTTAMSHTYMGEHVPKIYLQIEKYVMELRKEKHELPIASLKDFSTNFSDKDLLKRALSLLNMWGVCVYLPQTEDLSSTVILDPKFLAKDVLAQLFNPNLVSSFKDGIFNHSDLVHIWTTLKKRDDFQDIAPILLSLMETFEVCFRLDPDKPFFDQRSVVPAKLPENAPPQLQNWWTPDPGQNTFQIERIIKFNVIPKEMIARLLVRIHKSIEEKLIWRYGMYFDREHSKGLIQIDMAISHLTLSIRGTKRDECHLIMDEVMNHIKETSGLYPGIQLQQLYKHKGGLIDLESCLIAYGDLAEMKKLPYGNDCDQILFNAGLIDRKDSIDEPKGDYFWNYEVTDQWAKNPMGYSSILCLNNDQILQLDLYNNLKNFVGDTKDIKQAYAVHSNLSTKFEDYIKVMVGKKDAIRRLFLKDEWKSLPDPHKREEFMGVFNSKASKHYWNHGTNPDETLLVLPMMHGTDEETCWKVCGLGFGASAYDGYYGKGIYFTSDLDYSKQFAIEKAGENGKIGAVVCLVMPGNVLPVIEHPTLDEKGNPFTTRDDQGIKLVPNPEGYHHQNVRKGYNSHYTLVPQVPVKEAFPIKGNYDSANHADQLVIFQQPQALPLFVVFFK